MLLNGERPREAQTAADRQSHTRTLEEALNGNVGTAAKIAAITSAQDATVVTQETVTAAMGRSGGAITEITEALSLGDRIPERIRELLYEHEEILYASRPSNPSLVLKLIAWAIPMMVIVVSLVMREGLFRLLTLTFVALLVVGMWVIYLKWKNQYSIITNSRTLKMTGIFNVRVEILKNTCIQFTLINAGIIDRWIGLNIVKLLTAASHGLLNNLFDRNPGCITFNNVNSTRVMQSYVADHHEHPQRQRRIGLFNRRCGDSFPVAVGEQGTVCSLGDGFFSSPRAFAGWLISQVDDRDLRGGWVEGEPGYLEQIAQIFLERGEHAAGVRDHETGVE